MNGSQRAFLESLFRIAVAAAHPAACLPQHLPAAPERGRLIVLAAGKAAGSMSEVAEQHYENLPDIRERLAGIAVTRRGYGRPTRIIHMIEAGHPVPDEAGLQATARVLALADAAGPEDTVLVLISGGGSANWIAPVEGVTLAEKQDVTRALLRSGAAIGEINVIRKHLSRIKGGRLAQRAYPARVLTLAISDVPADDPSIIGSGPTVGDPSTLADARAIVSRYQLQLPASVICALDDAANETPKPDDRVFSASEVRLIARPMQSFHAAQKAIQTAGYECVFLGDRLEGEARAVAGEHARLAKTLAAAGRRAVILSGGELTVTLKGKGRGGPNQEYALALAMALDGTRGIAALAADTDGTDGGQGHPDDPAGAFADGTSAGRARRLGRDPLALLADNNSTDFFDPLGDLLTPGPTYTNVNDFRAIVIDSA